MQNFFFLKKKKHQTDSLLEGIEQYQIQRICDELREFPSELLTTAGKVHANDFPTSNSSLPVLSFHWGEEERDAGFQFSCQPLGS